MTTIAVVAATGTAAVAASTATSIATSIATPAPGTCRRSSKRGAAARKIPARHEAPPQRAPIPRRRARTPPRRAPTPPPRAPTPPSLAPPPGRSRGAGRGARLLQRSVPSGLLPRLHRLRRRKAPLATWGPPARPAMRVRAGRRAAGRHRTGPRRLCRSGVRALSPLLHASNRAAPSHLVAVAAAGVLSHLVAAAGAPRGQPTAAPGRAAAAAGAVVEGDD